MESYAWPLAWPTLVTIARLSVFIALLPIVPLCWYSTTSPGIYVVQGLQYTLSFTCEIENLVETGICQLRVSDTSDSDTTIAHATGVIYDLVCLCLAVLSRRRHSQGPERAEWREICSRVSEGRDPPSTCPTPPGETTYPYSKTRVWTSGNTVTTTPRLLA